MMIPEINHICTARLARDGNNNKLKSFMKCCNANIHCNIITNIADENMYSCRLSRRWSK